MRQFEKKLVLIFALCIGILPAQAKFNAKASKSVFFDKNTIMIEEPFSVGLKEERYWEQNLLFFNKYRPIFMLSNKELYNLMPSENISVSKRISAPSVYNISLKSASIKTISLNQKLSANKSTEAKNDSSKIKTDSSNFVLYTEAKNSQIQSERKLEIAELIKKTKIASDYDLSIDLLNEVIVQEPYNAYAFYLKGELYAAQNKPDEAMKSYIQALKINPTSKQCCLGIAKILEPTNKTLAQKYYQKAK